MKFGKKVLFIGDLHGNNDWEQMTKDALKHFYDIVFLGDYVDSFHIKSSQQLYNLNNLCHFIRKNKDKVSALLGNHDYAYIHNIDSISGKQYMQAHEYKKIFQDNLDLFQIAWGYTNPDTKKYTLATHAGLTNGYYKFYLENEKKEGELIHDTLNRIQSVKDMLWVVGPMRGGRAKAAGPLWADYQEVLDDLYKGINQVFGHTPQLSPRLDHFGDDFVACIDNWGNKKGVSMLITL